MRGVQMRTLMPGWLAGLCANVAFVWECFTKTPVLKLWQLYERLCVCVCGFGN
jgi:hypothetical protein